MVALARTAVGWGNESIVGSYFVHRLFFELVTIRLDGFPGVVMLISSRNIERL